MKLVRLHVILATLAALPVLAWAISGFLLASPSKGTASGPGVIDGTRVRISPQDALSRASAFHGRPLPVTALTLLMRDGRPAYQAVGGLGPNSLYIDAETGDVARPAAPPPVDRFVRQAHYFFFAGKAQTPLLLVCSALAAMAALSGLALSIGLALKTLRR